MDRDMMLARDVLRASLQGDPGRAADLLAAGVEVDAAAARGVCAAFAVIAAGALRDAYGTPDDGRWQAALDSVSQDGDGPTRFVRRMIDAAAVWDGDAAAAVYREEEVFAAVTPGGCVLETAIARMATDTTRIIIIACDDMPREMPGGAL